MKKTETKELNPARDALPSGVAEAIEDVLWYLWEEARDGFIADGPGPGEGHIFRSLVALDGWFSGHDATAEEFIEEFCSDDDRASSRARVRSLRGGDLPIHQGLGKEEAPITSASTIRGTTRALIEALMRNEWSSHATCIDFGIRTAGHLGALQFAPNHDGVAPEQFDAALGKGAEIQRLISPRNPYRHATFRTDWDEMPSEADED